LREKYNVYNDKQGEWYKRERVEVRVEVICVLLYVCIDDDVMSGSITAS
jgi:hypothetical protein